MAKKALITGISGQDGSYLTELLLSKGYEVHGIVRRTAAPYRGYLDRVPALSDSTRLFLHHGDLADAGSLIPGAGTSGPASQAMDQAIPMVADRRRKEPWRSRDR